MADSKRYFSLAQANAVVNAIRPLLAEVMEIRRAILARQPEIWPVVAKAAGNGGGIIASQLAQEFHRLDFLVREILRTGAEIKDLDQGLVDFRALREGREVYLCWRFGEGKIAFWHEIETGFAGRQPIT